MITIIIVTLTFLAVIFMTSYFGYYCGEKDGYRDGYTDGRLDSYKYRRKNIKAYMKKRIMEDYKKTKDNKTEK